MRLSEKIYVTVMLVCFGMLLVAIVGGCSSAPAKHNWQYSGQYDRYDVSR